MIYVLIYWIVGVVVNLLLTLFIERTEKHTWVSFLSYWIVLPFIFPLTLIVLKDEIADGFKKKTHRSEKKSMKTEPSTPLNKQEAAETKEDDDPFEKEWQAFIKDTVPNKDVTLIELKVVVDNYMVSKDYKKMVMYLEDSHNEKVNAFIKKNHHVISEIFKQWDYFFMYAPKEMETIANHYDTSMPEVKWDASKLLELQGCRLDEPIGTAMAVIEDVEWDDEQDCWVATMRGVQLDAENEHDLTEQIRGYWGVLNKKYKEEKEESRRFRYRMADDDEEPKCHIAGEMKTKYYGDGEEASMTSTLFTTDGESTECKREVARKENRKCSISQERRLGFSDILEKLYHLDEELTEEDVQLLSEINERVEKLRQRGIRQHLIEQFVKMTVPTSHLQVTADACILLTDYNKEVQMLPIDKVVYILYLRHPEGISIKSLADHKEELITLYARILGKTGLTNKQKESVDRLCDPTDNSINEKLSRIRKSFCAEVHDSVADSYVIQGTRGEDRYITLDEELIELGDWGRPSFSSSVSHEGS